VGCLRRVDEVREEEDLGGSGREERSVVELEEAMVVMAGWE